jgi:hypothetical protein
VIDEADEPKIGGDGLAHLAVVVEALIVDLAGAHCLEVGMMRALLGRVERGPRHLVFGIEVIPARACDQREMRAHKRDEEHPWLSVLALGAFAEPRLRGPSDPIIVVLVAGLPATGVGGEAQGSLAPWWRIAQHADGITDPIHDVQRHVLFAEAVVVLGAAEVQLADRIDAMTRRSQPVCPGGDAAVIGVGIIPKANVVHVAPGMETGARGYADRRIAVGIGKAQAAACQLIEIGRLDHGMAMAAEHAPAVFVRHDEQ